MRWGYAGTSPANQNLLPICDDGFHTHCCWWLIPHRTRLHGPIDRFITSVKGTAKKLLPLNTSKTCDPDGIPTWILKEYGPSVVRPGVLNFNSSLWDGYIPQMWKAEDVCPIPRVPSPSLTEKDLRPIQPITVLCKLLERVVIERAAE